MVYYEINRKNYRTGNPNLIDKLNKHLRRDDNKIFILFYMEGCGPCNATRPEWSKLENILTTDFLNKDNIAIVAIDKDVAGKLKNVGKQPNSFPTIRYITKSGKINENYEDSNIEKKDRTIDSFVEWIKNKTGEKEITTSEVKVINKKSNKILNHKKTRKHNRHIKTHKEKNQRKNKWTIKYKNSINCKKPKGFSQKQYCKYGRNK